MSTRSVSAEYSYLDRPTAKSRQSEGDDERDDQAHCLRQPRVKGLHRSQPLRIGWPCIGMKHLLDQPNRFDWHRALWGRAFQLIDPRPSDPFFVFEISDLGAQPLNDALRVNCFVKHGHYRLFVRVRSSLTPTEQVERGALKRAGLLARG
jgi:hypothetical protein